MNNSTTLFTLFLLLLCSTVNAQNWSNIGPGGGSDLHYLAIQPDNPDVMYTAGDIEGIYKTTDGGTTWQNTNNNLAHSSFSANAYWVNDIQIDPVNYQTLYLCTAVGLFKSINGGGGWNLMYPDTIDDNLNEPISTSAIGIDSANTNRLFLGLGDETSECTFADFTPWTGFEEASGMLRSVDGGITWVAINNGLPDSVSVHTVNVIPNTDIVVIATNRGVFRSDDGGNNWAAKNSGLPHTNTHRIVYSDDYGSDVLTLSVKTIGDPNDANTFQGGMFRSFDLGDSWTDITNNLPKYDAFDFLFYDYWKFDVDPTDIDVIYVATVRGSGYDNTGIFETLDGGATWNNIYTPEIGGWLDQSWLWEGYAFDIKMAPSNPSRMALVLIDAEVSTDWGGTWINAFTTAVGGGWKGNGLELMNTEGIAFHPTDPNVLYVSYDDMGLFRSDDADNSYIRLDPHQDPNIDGITNIDAAKDVLIDPANGDVYLSRYQGSQGGYLDGFSAGGVFFSSDNGNTFNSITGSMPAGRHNIIADFNSGSPGNRTLYSAVHHHGVYKSTNSGTSWTNITGSLGSDEAFVWDIALNPTNPQELVVAINGWGSGNNGVYRSLDGGTTWNALPNTPAGDVNMVYFNSNNLYIGVSDNFDWNYAGGLYRSSDGGTSWTEILDHSRVVDVAVNPGNPNVMVATAQQWYNVNTEAHGIYLSEDNGATWNLISQNVDHAFFNFARFNPHHPTDVYAGTAGGGLWKSTLSISVGIDAPTVATLGATLYPNPATHQVWVQHEGGAVQINLLSLDGRVLQSIAVQQQRVQLEVGHLAAGAYLVEVLDATGAVKRMKLLKQ